MLQKLNELSIKIISISTNGYFSSETYMKELDHILDENVVFRISLDSLEINELTNIRKGYDANYDYNILYRLEKLNYNVIITTIISFQDPANFYQICDFITKFSNIIKWNVRPLIPTQESHVDIDSNWKRIEQIYENIISWYSKNKCNFTFVLGNVLSNEELNSPENINIYSGYHHPCRNERNQRTLKSNSHITRCPILSEINQKYSVYYKQYNQKENTLFEKLSTQEMLCAQCKYYILCGGGCRAYAISHTNLEGCDINSRKTLE